MKKTAQEQFDLLRLETKKAELLLTLEAMQHGTKRRARLLRLADRLHRLCESTGPARRRATWAAVAEALQGN